MKFLPGCSLTFLLLSVLIPKDIEALAPLIMTRLGQMAARKGWTLAKMTYYPQCTTVNDPPDMNCPSEVFGIGMNPSQAKLTSRMYASMFGNKACAQFVGECVTHKFLKGVVQIVKKLPGILGK